VGGLKRASHEADAKYGAYKTAECTFHLLEAWVKTKYALDLAQALGANESPNDPSIHLWVTQQSVQDMLQYHVAVQMR
jgi:hypothetical protein